MTDYYLKNVSPSYATQKAPNWWNDPAHAFNKMSKKYYRHYLFQKHQEGDVVPHGGRKCPLTGDQLQTSRGLAGTPLAPRAILPQGFRSAVIG